MATKSKDKARDTMLAARRERYRKSRERMAEAKRNGVTPVTTKNGTAHADAPKMSGVEIMAEVAHDAEEIRARRQKLGGDPIGVLQQMVATHGPGLVFEWMERAIERLIEESMHDRLLRAKLHRAAAKLAEVEP
jgi:hypothetical protein